MVIQNLRSFLVLEQGELQLESDEENQFTGESFAIRGVGIPTVCMDVQKTHPTTFFRIVRGQSVSVK